MSNSKIPLATLLVRTASVTGVSIAEMCGRSRERPIVDARQLFCCVSFYSGHTMVSIGETIGRDHSTVSHLCNERPLPANAEATMIKIREGSEVMDRISSLAFTVYNNPNDQDARAKLKRLL